MRSIVLTTSRHKDYESRRTKDCARRGAFRALYPVRDAVLVRDWNSREFDFVGRGRVMIFQIHATFLFLNAKSLFQ